MARSKAPQEILDINETFNKLSKAKLLRFEKFNGEDTLSLLGYRFENETFHVLLEQQNERDYYKNKIYFRDKNNEEIFHLQTRYNGPNPIESHIEIVINKTKIVDKKKVDQILQSVDIKNVLENINAQTNKILKIDTEPSKEDLLVSDVLNRVAKIRKDLEKNPDSVQPKMN